MDAALMFFFGLWALLGGKRSSSTSWRAWPETSPPSPSPPALPPTPTSSTSSTSSPPWPQVLPPGLPAFPGSGWEFDEPPPAAVQQRARALVSQLWARGRGSYKVEQTAGRWIAYQAQIVASGKQGVVAYREKRQRALPAPAAAPSRPAAPARPAAQPAPQAPIARPSAAPRPPMAPPAAVARPVSTSSPAPTSSPATSSPPAAAPSPLTLPVLRFGDGLKPQPPNPHVRLLQQRLGIDADGQFGPGTRTAVVEFQRRTGLAPNETNAQLMARGYGVVKQATWTKLFATTQA